MYVSGTSPLHREVLFFKAGIINTQRRRRGIPIPDSYQEKGSWNDPGAREINSIIELMNGKM